MTPEEIRAAVFLIEMRAQLEKARNEIQKPMWGYQWRNDKDYQKFMDKVLKPLTKSDL